MYTNQHLTALLPPPVELDSSDVPDTTLDEEYLQILIEVARDELEELYYHVDSLKL